MGKFTKCSKCGREYMGFLCPNGCDKKLEEKEQVKIKEEVKVVEKEVQETSGTYNGLPIYSASYLTHKLHKNYNSIKSEKICVAVHGGYVLHEDIIKQFILSLNN